MRQLPVFGAICLLTVSVGATLLAGRGRAATELATTKTTIAVAAKPLPGDVRKFMRTKLENAHKVMEGLAVEDFDQIKAGAAAMIDTSKQALWRQVQTPVYTQDTADFVDTAENLADAAAKQDLDAASLHFVKLTLKCVNCHKHVRGKKVAAMNLERVITASTRRTTQ